MRNDPLREKIRQAVILQSSAVGLGLACPHCGAQGGDWQSDIRDAFNPQKNGLNASIADTGRKVKNEFTNQNSLLSQAAKKVGNEFTDKNSILRGKIIPIAATVGKYIAPVLNSIVPLSGTALSAGLNAISTANEGAKAIGFGMKGKWSPEAKARARARAMDPKSHASKVKKYMQKHPQATLGEASRACAK